MTKTERAGNFWSKSLSLILENKEPFFFTLQLFHGDASLVIFFLNNPIPSKRNVLPQPFSQLMPHIPRDQPTTTGEALDTLDLLVIQPTTLSRDNQASRPEGGSAPG